MAARNLRGQNRPWGLMLDVEEEYTSSEAIDYTCNYAIRSLVTTNFY
jgi:hypothetical protein